MRVVVEILPLAHPGKRLGLRALSSERDQRSMLMTNEIQQQSRVGKAVRRALPASHPSVVAGITLLAGTLATGSALADYVQDLAISNGLTISGDSSQSDGYSGTGGHVASAGDFNGDGLADVLVASRVTSESFLIFGSKTATGDEILLTDVDGTSGVALRGVGSYGEGVGDFNGDGIDDIGFSGGQVVFGTTKPLPPVVDLAILDGTNGVQLKGAVSVTRGGDLNNDGVADVLARGSGPGMTDALVIFGAAGDWPAEFDASNLDGKNGFGLNGVNEEDEAGAALSDAGDFNGDGIDDLIIGAPGVDAEPSLYYYDNQDVGESYVVFGTAEERAPIVSLADLNGDNGLVIKASVDPVAGYSDVHAGWKVSAAGDMNADGHDDVLIAARGDRYSGYVYSKFYVVFGVDSGISAIDARELDGSDGFTVRTSDPAYSIAESPSDVGDFNGDGIDDIVVGRGSFYEPTGSANIIFGRQDGFPANLEGGGKGRFISSLESDNLGSSVAGIGDFNGDGLNDVILGAPNGYDNSYYGTAIGKSYVIFGGARESMHHVQCFAAIDASAGPAVAAVSSDGDTVIKRPGVQGKVEFNFESWWLGEIVGTKVLNDMNNNGSKELIAVGQASGNTEVRDSLSGEQLASTGTYLQGPVTAFALVSDLTGDGVEELIVAGRGELVVMDMMNSQTLSRFGLRGYFDPIDVAVVADLNGNGVPEVQILGKHKDPARSDKIEVHDLFTGELLHEYYAGRGWRLPQQTVLANIEGGSGPEAVLLRSSETIDYQDVVLRDITSAMPVPRARFIGYDPQMTSIRVSSINDLNGNGTDEVVVLGQRQNAGKIRAVVKDGSSRQWLNSVYFANDMTPLDMVICPDVNGNGTSELAVVGERNLDGKLRVNIKDPGTNKSLGRVLF